MSGEFFDTNILVYAHDKSAGRKFEIAAGLIRRALDLGNGLISVQVLMELFVALTRKIQKPMPVKTAEEILADFAAWEVFSPLPDDVLEAARLSRVHRINPWDALIVQAARKMKASVIWTEDMNDGQVIGGIPIKNPFRI